MTADQRPHAGDEGSATLFFAVAVVALLILAGLVADGGAKVQALQRADAVAAEAARAGGQAIDLPTAIVGDPVAVDVRSAVAAAQSYLAAAGMDGSVHVAPADRRLTVRTTTTTDTTFLGLIGIHQLRADGAATVTLVRGITGAQP